MMRQCILFWKCQNVIFLPQCLNQCNETFVEFCLWVQITFTKLPVKTFEIWFSQKILKSYNLQLDNFFNMGPYWERMFKTLLLQQLWIFLNLSSILTVPYEVITVLTKFASWNFVTYNLKLTPMVKIEHCGQWEEWKIANILEMAIVDRNGVKFEIREHNMGYL